MANEGDLRSLGKEIEDAYKDRIARIKAVKKETDSLLKENQRESRTRAADVAKLLDDYDKAHKEMSTQLEATLAEVRPTLAKNEAGRESQTQAEIKARADEITKMLADFDKAHKEMSTQLEATLAEVRPTLAKNEAGRKSQAVAEVKQRAADVTNMLDGFRRDQAETAAAWQELLATMRSTREAKPLAKKEVPPTEMVETPTKMVEEVAVEKVREMPVEKPKVKEIPVVEEVAVEKVKEMPVGKSLEKQVLFLVEDSHGPKGIKLTEMEKILGVPRIKLGGITRSLLNANKIRKEGISYLPKEKR